MSISSNDSSQFDSCLRGEAWPCQSRNILKFRMADPTRGAGRAWNGPACSRIKGRKSPCRALAGQSGSRRRASRWPWPQRWPGGQTQCLSGQCLPRDRAQGARGRLAGLASPASIPCLCAVRVGRLFLCAGSAVCLSKIWDPFLPSALLNCPSSRQKLEGK